MNRESYSTEQLLKNNDPDEDIIVDTTVEGILEQQSPHETRHLEKMDSIDLNTHHSSSILNNSSEDDFPSIVDTTVSSNSAANFNTQTAKSITISSEDTESIARKYYNPNKEEEKEEKDTSLGQTSQTTDKRDFTIRMIFC